HGRIICHPAIKNDSGAILVTGRIDEINNRALDRLPLRWNRPERGQKKAGPESRPSRLSRLRHLSTDSSNDDGGGGNSGARRTNSKADNSHSTDTVGNSYRGNTHNNPDSQPQFRPKPERQNAALERKPIHLPPMQLKEVFSYNFPFLFVVLLGMEAPAKDFLGALKMRLSL
ncbi:MAG TPA: hypothetical protein VFU09_11760, partial [Candidatus Udaeobacter sp.]|nr:hypothetical protein [Candidatus Udaeobacter sp.]